MYAIHGGIMLYWEFQVVLKNSSGGFRDKDMVRLNVCPLVNSIRWIASSILRFDSKKDISQVMSALTLDRLRPQRVDWQTFWPTISPQWDPSASGREGVNDWSPSMSAAWVIQKSYSQVKLWPFNGTYCKGICWSLSGDTNSLICRGALSVFAQALRSVQIRNW